MLPVHPILELFLMSNEKMIMARCTDSVHEFVICGCVTLVDLYNLSVSLISPPKNTASIGPFNIEKVCSPPIRVSATW